ncbi:MAG: hypothetical protein IJB75_08235 [Oscillospiraceae bacterium]|nr:hypothetical protein [Oscillospiraceae bacterium]
MQKKLNFRLIVLACCILCCALTGCKKNTGENAEPLSELKSGTVVEQEEEPIVSDEVDKQEDTSAVTEPPSMVEQKPQEEPEPVSDPVPEVDAEPEPQATPEPESAPVTEPVIQPEPEQEQSSDSTPEVELNTPEDPTEPPPASDGFVDTNAPDFDPYNREGYVYVPGFGYVEIEEDSGFVDDGYSQGGKDFWEIIENGNKVGY